MEKELTRYALKSGYIEKVVVGSREFSPSRATYEKLGKSDFSC